MRNFRKYDLWQDSIYLVDEIYKAVADFPNTEKYGLQSQITRAAISIPSNIAEGSARESEKDFARFIQIALGSAYELETQLIISLRQGYLSNDQSKEVLDQIQSIQKRLLGLKEKLTT